jgi:hypothetical protein
MQSVVYECREHATLVRVEFEKAPKKWLLLIYITLIFEKLTRLKLTRMPVGAALFQPNSYTSARYSPDCSGYPFLAISDDTNQISIRSGNASTDVFGQKR